MKRYKFYYFELANRKNFHIAEIVYTNKETATKMFLDKYPETEYLMFAVEG